MQKNMKTWWGFIGVVLGAGWAAYGILGGGKVFLAVMVVASSVLGGGMAMLSRQSRE